MPDSYYDPPDPHECDLPDCDGDECERRALEAYEDYLIEQADAERKERQ